MTEQIAESANYSPAIPEDIMAKARRVALQDHKRMPTIEAIARALMEERERCAKIAENAHPADMAIPAVSVATRYAIAIAIRAGGKNE